MRPLALVLALAATSPVVWAQSRSSAHVIQTGGSPNLASFVVSLVAAKPIQLTGAVDSSSPAVWDFVSGQQTMIVLTSFAGRTSRALGNLDALTPAVPVKLRPWPGGGVWMRRTRTSPRKASIMSPTLASPSAWTVPAKIMDGGQWYPQVIGLEAGAGTDKFAGQEARFFMSGRSSFIIRFNRLAGLTSTR